MQSVSASTSSFQSVPPHLHLDNEACPWCDRDIPPELLEEIRGKIAVKEREQTLAITAKLEQQYAADKAQADAKAKADLELERQHSAARETAAREDERKTAEAAAAEKLAEAEHIRQELQAGLQQQVTQAEEARVAAEQTGATLQTQFEQFRQESEAALAAAKAEAETRESEIRAEAQRAAEAVVAEKLTASENARLVSEAMLQAQITEAETTRIAAEQKGAALQEQLLALQQTTDAELTKLREDAVAEAVRIRLETIAATEASMRDKILANEQAVTEATAKAQEAESKLAVFTDQHESIMNERLTEQREILEKAKSEEINAVKAKAFEENQKQVDKLNEMQRALEKKTNEELGEGAEIDLFESLKAEFPDDRITRIGKGVQGADVLHVVILNGKDCGTIIYNSKNHGRFLTEHVTKLRADQLAAKAVHAILSTRKFPAKTSQLHIEDGVLLANPARVVALATLIRQHMIQIYTLRMSGAERESKTAALYDFITSDRYTQFLSRVDANTQTLLDLQVKEKKFHDTAWKKEGELIKQIQKTQADLSTEINCIIGIAADEEPEFEETEL